MRLYDRFDLRDRPRKANTTHYHCILCFEPILKKQLYMFVSGKTRGSKRHLMKQDCNENWEPIKFEPFFGDNL